MRYRRPMLDALHVEIDKLVDRSSEERPQHLRKHETACDCAHKRCIYRLSGQNCRATTVQVPIFQHLLVCGSFADIFVKICSFSWTSSRVSRLACHLWSGSLGSAVSWRTMACRWFPTQMCQMAFTL